MKVRKQQENNINVEKNNKNIENKKQDAKENVKENALCKLYCNNKFIGYGISEGEFVKRDILVECC